MSYYRPSPMRLVWGIAIACALALALWLAGRTTVAAIRADERATVLAEGDALLRQSIAHGAKLARERDSLRTVVAQVDTVLVTRLRTIRDTAWLPADTAPRVRLAACIAAMDSLATDCASFRRTALAALALADTTRRNDSTGMAGLALQLAAVRRADSSKAAQLASRSRWRTIERGVCVGAVAGHLFQWSAR